MDIAEQGIWKTLILKTFDFCVRTCEAFLYFIIVSLEKGPVMAIAGLFKYLFATV